MNNLHTCACGEKITTGNGWNDYNTTLRCEACTERRQALLAEITAAIAGKSVETVYVASNLRDLVNINDFTDVEISYRRSEKMAGQAFMVEA